MANNFLLSEELSEFQVTLQKFLLAAFPSKVIRDRLLESEVGTLKAPLALSSDKWAALSETGCILAVAPAKVGGLGFGCQAAQMAIFEAGRVLATVPLFETIALGLRPLLLAGVEDEAANAIGRILEQQMPASGAFQELCSGAPLCRAERGGDGWVITGDAKLVPSYAQAAIVLIPAIEETATDQVGLFSLTTDRSGVLATHHRSFDLLRPYTNLRLTRAKATLLGVKPRSVFNYLAQEISLLATAEMVGAASRAVEITADYVKTRKQFGKAISSFQAISHLLADMLLQVEAAAALNRFAAWAADHDPAQLEDAARASKAHASEEMPKVLEKALQCHGGIGFTYEYDLHLYLRRVQSLSASYGTSTNLYSALGEKGVRSHTQE